MEEIAIAVAVLLEKIEHAGTIKEPLLAVSIGNLRTQLEDIQLQLDTVPVTKPRPPSQARGSAGGTDPLHPGKHRPLPKPDKH